MKQLLFTIALFLTVSVSDFMEFIERKTTEK